MLLLQVNKSSASTMTSTVHIYRQGFANHVTSDHARRYRLLHIHIHICWYMLVMRDANALWSLIDIVIWLLSAPPTPPP